MLLVYNSKWTLKEKQKCNGKISQFKDLRWFLCSTVNKMWLYETCRSWHCVFIYILQCLSFSGVWVKNEPRTKAWSALITSLWTEQIILITWRESSQMFILLSVVCLCVASHGLQYNYFSQSKHFCNAWFLQDNINKQMRPLWKLSHNNL